MKTLYSLAVLFILLGVGANSQAQQFNNSDLDGEINGVSSMPNSWEAVPYTDKICYADEAHECTPDLANEVGFTVVEGIRAKAFSGKTFVTGLDYGTGKHHEGIMQKLEGLVPGQKYSISLYQAVIKQYNALDTSGSWSVYADDKLLAVTEVTGSQLHWDALDVKWEQRIVEFTATKKSHVIKFMPTDDDKVYDHSHENGCLRMGIDKIELVEQEEEVDTTIVVEVPKDTVENPNVEIVKIPDTTRLDVIKLITEVDPLTNDRKVVLKEPKEVIFQRPGPIDFQIVAEQEAGSGSNPSSGSFRVVTKELDYTLTITDMVGRVILKKENCTHEELVSLNRNGHFLVIMTKGRYKAAKKLIVQT